jgi:hypothetical protein
VKKINNNFNFLLVFETKARKFLQKEGFARVWRCGCRGLGLARVWVKRKKKKRTGVAGGED